MKREELLEHFAGLVPTLQWKWYDSSQLKTEWQGYTLFLDDKGRLQCWQGSMLLIPFTELEGGLEVYESTSQGLRRGALEELARCFEPAPTPTGLEEL